MPKTASPPSHTFNPAKAYVAPHLKEYDYKDSLESTSWSDTPKQDLSSLLSDAKRRKAAQRAPPPPATATPIRKQQRESRRIDFVPLADRDKHRRSKLKPNPNPKRKGPAPSATALLEEQGKSAPMLLNSMFERGMLQWDYHDDETHGHCLRVHDHRAMGHYIGTEKVKARLRNCGLVHPSPRHQWWLVPQSARAIPPRYGRVGPGDDADPIVLRPPPQWALEPLERCARFFGWRMDAPNGEHSENGFGCVVPKTSHQPCQLSDPPPPPPPQRPDYSLPLPPQESCTSEPEPEPEPEPERYALQDFDNLDAMAF